MEFVVTDTPGVDWDAFVGRHTDLLFYSAAWSRVLEKGLGGKTCCMMLNEGEEILCALPAVSLSYGGARLLYCTFPHGGMVGEASLFARFSGEIVNATRYADILYMTPFSLSMEEGTEVFFDAEPEAATRLDLAGKTLEEIRVAFGSSAKFGIKKARRSSLEVVRCRDRDSFRVAYSLYRQSMRRNRAIVRYPLRWFEALHDELGESGLATVYMAKLGNRPVSAMVLLRSGKGVHFLHIGSETEFLPLCGNDLVVSRVIDDAVNEGLEYVDFMLSDPQDANLIRWKEKFGGRTVPVNKYRRVNRPFKVACWNAAKRVYAAAHRFGLQGRS